MAVLALAYIGSAIGATAFGAGVVAFGLTGAQIGMAAGSVLGQMLFAPTMHSEGPRLADLKAAQASYGSVIPYLEGHPRLAGVLVWASEKRELATTTSAGGSGGGSDQTTYTYECDVMYMLSENEAGALRRVWKNGALVWSRADDADADTVDASDQAELWTRITFYDGSADQLPDPTYEAWAGVGNAPAYRSRSTVFIEGFQLGSSGQLPNLTFEVVVGGTGGDSGNGPVFEVLFDDGTPNDSGSGHLVPYTVGSDVTFPVAGDPATGHMRCSHASEAPRDSIVGYSGGVLNRPADTLINIEFYTSWSLLAFVTGHTIFEWYEGPGEYHVVTYYVNAGTLRWTYNGAHMDAPYRIPINTRTKIEMRMEPDGTATLSIDGDLQITRTVSHGAYTTGQVILGSNVSGAYDYTIDNVRIWYGEPSPVGLVTLDEPTLQEVVERQCVRGGLSLDQVDATDLATRNVHAMVISQISSPRQVIEMLAGAYLFSAVESGDTLRFKFFGGAPVADIPYADLVAEDEADPLPIIDANDLELPVQVFVKYMNLMDDYQDGSENSDRLVSSGQNTSSIELPLGFTPTQAKRISDMNLQKTLVEARRFGPFKLSRSYAALEPTDVVILNDAYGNSYRARLGKESQAAGVLQFDAVADHAIVYTSHAQTGTVGYTNSSTIRLPLQTDALLLDMPILRDADNNAGFYAAVKPHVASTSFPGAMLFKSTDGTSYEATVSVDQQSVFGTASTVLADGPTGVFDEVNSLTVDVVAGTLSSSTRAAMLDGPANAMLVGSEVIQFRDVALVSPGVYTLTGLLRGRRGTEWATATHAEGESVALLTNALQRVPMAASELHAEKQWKAVTVGRAVASATAQPFTDNGVGLMPFAPVNLRRTLDTDGRALFTWDRRTRLACNPFTGAFPLGEDSEQYYCELEDGGGGVIASQTVTAPQWLPGASGTALGRQLETTAWALQTVGGQLYGILDDFTTNVAPKTVARFDSSGRVSARSPSLGHAIGQAVTAAGILYVTAMSYSAITGAAIEGAVRSVALADLSTIAAEYIAGTPVDPAGIAHDGTYVWVTERDSGNVRKLDATTLASLASYALEPGIEAVTYSAGSLWICQPNTDELIEWDVATHTEVQRFSVVHVPVDVLLVGGRVYVQGWLHVGVYSTAGVLQTLCTCSAPGLPGRYMVPYGADVAALDASPRPRPERIKVIDGATGVETPTPIQSPYTRTDAISGDTTGALWVTGTAVGGARVTNAMASGSVDLDGALVRVYQLSAKVGRGYPAELALT